MRWMDNLQAMAAAVFKRVRRLLRRPMPDLIIPVQPPPEIPVTIRPEIVTPFPEVPVIAEQKSSHPSATIEPPPASRKQRRANDAEMRRYEKARLRQDVWATPKGPQPVKQKRGARPAPPPIAIVAEEPAAIDNADDYIVDRINDVEEDVLVKPSEMWGEFNFRDSILAQLDRYFVYLQRMKHYDPGAYGLYRNVGAVIVPRVATATHWREEEPVDKKFSPEEIESMRKSVYLTPHFKSRRPAFGCVAYGTDTLVEKHEQSDYKDSKGRHQRDVYIPKFLYFTKYQKPPPEVQPVRDDGDVYKMTLYWDHAYDKKQKWGVPSEFAIFISADAKQMRVLRMLDTKIFEIPKKHSSWEVSRVPQRAWTLPPGFGSWAGHHGVETELYMAYLFCRAVREIEYSNLSMVRVAVTKDNMVAVFGVHIHRMAYFFADRDIALTGSGLRKRMFHIVRPHVRSDGTEVKMHFRGERKFSWAGYEVEVTVPGLDHLMIPEINIGMVDDHWNELDDKQHLSEQEFGKRLKKYMQQGLGGYRRPD